MSEPLYSVSLELDAGSHALAIAAERFTGGYRLRLVGDADCATECLLELVLALVVEDPRGGTVTLDLHELSFFSARCVGMLASAEERLRNQDRRLVVRSPSPIVRRMLEICDLASTIDASSTGTLVDANRPLRYLDGITYVTAPTADLVA